VNSEKARMDKYGVESYMTVSEVVSKERVLNADRFCKKECLGSQEQVVRVVEIMLRTWEEHQQCLEHEV
jgi:hypothetical protein